MKKTLYAFVILLVMGIATSAFAAGKTMLTYQQGMSVQDAEKRGAKLVEGKLVDRLHIGSGEWTMLADREGDRLGMLVYLARQPSVEALDDIIDELDVSGFMPIHVDRNGITQDLYKRHAAGASYKECFKIMDDEIDAFQAQGEGKLYLIFVPMHVFNALSDIPELLERGGSLFASEPVIVFTLETDRLACISSNWKETRSLGK